MMEIDMDPEFGVCPKCGGDTRRIKGKWVCKNCEYEEEIQFER